MAQERIQRRLAAILVADVVGYSRLIRADEEGTLGRLRALRAELIDPKISEHRGRIVKLMGDGMLAEFASAVDAVHMATEVQQAMAEHNAEVPQEQRIEFRVGINLGDVVIDGDDIHGDGVNVASRLEGLAEPGGICISGKVFEEVRDRIELPFEDMGDQEVKNIDRPVRVWGWVANSSVVTKTVEPLPLPDKPSIAVLPFINMSGDPEQEYFSDGITEDIITTLSKISSLFVIARSSTLTYKGAPIDVKRAARELGVRYVAEGSVRKVGQRVRITAQLIDATTGHQLWAERYDRDLQDVFALQEEITQEIVTALEVRLSEGEQVRVWRKHAADVHAYEHFQRGRELYLEFTKEANSQSQREFAEALEINREFADAMVYLAWAHNSDARFGWSRSPEVSWKTALDLLRQAIAVDETVAAAYSTFAYIHLFHGEYEEALANAERAVALNPNGADEYHILAMVHCYSGQPEEAIDEQRQALRLNPLSPTMSLVELGRAFWQMGRYEDAVGPLMQVVARRPYWHSARLLLALAFNESGREKEATVQVKAILRSNRNFSLVAEAKTHPYKNPADLQRYVDALRKAGLPQ